MTDKTQYNDIFEMWRKYNLKETSIYSYTGTAKDPDDPLKVWDPDSIKKTRGSDEKGYLSGDTIKGVMDPGKIESEAVKFGIKAAAVAGVTIAGFKVLSLIRKIWPFLKTVFKGGKAAGLARLAVGAAGAPTAIIGAIIGIGVKAALVGAVAWALYEGYQYLSKEMPDHPAIATDHSAGPGTEEFVGDINAGTQALGVRSWQAADLWLQCSWCKKNSGRQHPKIYGEEGFTSASSSEKLKLRAAFDKVKKEGPFCKDILEKCGNMGQNPPGMTPTEADIDALMRMLKAETSWARSADEMSAIVQVAINRKMTWGRKNILSVVAPTVSGWNNKSEGYARNFNNAHKSYNTTRAKKARQLINNIFKNGSTTGDLGGALNWLHPRGMPKTDKPHGEVWKRTWNNGKTSTFISYDFKGDIGKRRLPRWAVSRKEGGSSRSTPTFVGKMLYSNAGRGFKSSVAKNSSSKSNVGSKIVAIGDSITADNNSWVDVLGGTKYAQKNLGSTAIKNNIFKKRIVSQDGKTLSKPEFLVILAGINNHLKSNKVISDLKYMAYRAQSKGIKVKIVALLPSAGYWNKNKDRFPGGDERSLAKIKEINDWIKSEEWKTIEGSSAVDTSSLADSKGRLKYSGDKLHPDARGQKVLASLINKSLKV